MNHKSADLVEKHLRAQLENNLREKTWPSNNVVIRRLLGDAVNLREAWRELLDTCPFGRRVDGRDYDQWQVVVDTIVDVAAGWSPEKTAKMRNAIKDAVDITAEIARTARALAELLRKRARLCEEAQLSKTPNDSHPIDLFDPAARIADRDPRWPAETYSRFHGFVDQSLRDLDGRFDLKYWPRTADVVEALAEMQDAADFSGGHLSDDALSARQTSTRDFMRALDSALCDLSRNDVEAKFSHASYAALVNAACGLDQVESAQTVKKYRFDERKRNQ